MDTPNKRQPMEFSTREKPESVWSILAFAWRRKWLVVLVVIAGLGAGYLYFLQQPPLYQSSSQILIVEEDPQLGIQGVEVLTSSADLHTTLLRSQRVITTAVEELNNNSLARIRATPISEGEIMRNLRVSSGAALNTRAILQLTYKSEQRAECPIVLDAVVAAYRGVLDETYHRVSDKTIDLILEAKNQLEEEISATESKYRKALNDLPLLVSGDTAENIHELRLRQIEAARSAAMLDNSKLRAEIEALERALKQGSSREALNLIVGQLANGNPDLAQQANEPLQLWLEEQMLLERVGPDHPRVQNIRKQLELMRKYTGQGPIGDNGQPVGRVQPARDYYDIYLESLRERIKMNDQLIAEMGVQFDEEHTASKGLMNYFVIKETYQAEIERKSRLFDTVLKRLEEINLLKDREGTEIQSLHSPRLGQQIEPDLQRVMVTSSILSVLAGLALAFVVDAADRRFKSPDEIRSDLGVPVVGHIPVFRKAVARGQDSGDRVVDLQTVHSPRARVAEAYRAVRTALYFNVRNGQHQVIQITSPGPGDGKTTLAANLAVTVANSGKRVLLIDADFRRPMCHKLFGVDNKKGAISVLNGVAELPDVLRETGVENLSLLTSGPPPKNPAELLTGSDFVELLELVRSKFELVIVDSPPVLPVTDSLNVAPRVDGVLLVLRLTKSARNAGHRTCDLLQDVGANLLGVVVNGIGSERRNAGYGYQYGYGQPYQYYRSGYDNHGGTPSNGSSSDHGGYYGDVHDEADDSTSTPGHGRQ